MFWPLLPTELEERNELRCEIEFLESQLFEKRELMRAFEERIKAKRSGFIDECSASTLRGGKL